MKFDLLFRLSPSLFKSLEPFENLSMRQTFITVNFHQQTICFCSELSKFWEEFHIDMLLYFDT
jgi:hypothetical protein